MNRRRFFSTITGAAGACLLENKGSVAAPAPGQTQTMSPDPSRMYVGTQKGSSDKMLSFYRRCGVRHVCGDPNSWTLEGLHRLQERCERWGISLDLIALGMPRSVGLLGETEYRAKQIDQTCEQIRLAARAGISAIKYNLYILDVLRTGVTGGRGGAGYSTWEYDKALKEDALIRFGRFPAELFWQRITDFLERVIPVATEYQVKMACHPHDPGVPPQGYCGVQRVLGTVEGWKRFLEICPSPYHGLNFCVGTVAGNLEHPAAELLDVLRYFGRRKKLFNIHFRNIRGQRDNFQEVYLDEGDLDMVKVIQVLQEVGYEGMIMPDHVPSHPDDPGELQGLAFAFGYIQALLQAVPGKTAGR
ncbi:MAG: mannonate dehydratase [Acidobacteria bacterium]|nr:mannonate dehydratase [Acidobacteriota bacterium]